MARIWKCTICLLFLALTLKELIRHISIEHSGHPNFQVRCGIDGCPRSYDKINSLRRHIQRQHGFEEDTASAPDDACNVPGTIHDDQDHAPIHTLMDEEDKSTELNETNQPDGILDENNEDCPPTTTSEINISQQPVDLERVAAQFTVKLHSNCKITQVAIDHIVDGASTLVDQVKENLQSQVLIALKGNNEYLTNIVGEIFDKFENPFSNLGTAALQKKFMKNNFRYIRPIQYILGKRVAYKNKGAKRFICEKEDTMLYIPILETIERLLSNQRVFENIVCNPRQCKDGILYDVCDGQLFKQNQIFKSHPNSLQVILYHDEVEVCNPLGTHIGKHKIDLYYFTLSNISPKFRSRFCSIQLLAIAKAKDVARYGQNKILIPIVKDLQLLAEGHTFVVNGNEVKLYGSVVSCLGDTEGQQQWGGFKVKVGWSHQKCRHCLCNFDKMQKMFKTEDFTQRTMQQYICQCNEIITAPTTEVRKNLETTYGVTGRSILCDIPQLDIIEQLPQDIMHILLEGVVQYELRHILKHFFDEGLTTRYHINNYFSEMRLNINEESNRPQPLKESTFGNEERYKLKQSAQQARIFLRNLPFALHGEVNTENEYYQLILQLMLIVQICFSPVVSTDRVDSLKNIIEIHLKRFRELFPEVNITPKMHYLVHLPKQILNLGPLLRHSCTRFESRHNYSKKLATIQNFKNICLSLGEKYQLDECSIYENVANSHDHPIFANEKEHGPLRKIKEEAVISFRNRLRVSGIYSNPEVIGSIFSLKWIKICGQKFATHGGCIIAYDASFQTKMPLFGKIGSIWLIDEEIFFEYMPLITIAFEEGLMAYKVVENNYAVAMDLCCHKTMLDYNCYSLQEMGTELYVPLKYDLKTLIEQHIVGENPLGSN